MNVWEAHICPCNCLISKGGMFLNIGEGMKGLTPAQVTICDSLCPTIGNDKRICLAGSSHQTWCTVSTLQFLEGGAVQD